MTARSAWTANVWGGRAAIGSAENVLAEGDEECSLCYSGKVQINFLPCKHRACLVCVNRLRATNVFKPDAGVKCPFCRQFVDGYEGVEGDNLTNHSLREANRAAKAAALAREPNTAPPRQVPAAQAQAPAGEAAGGGAGGGGNWTCPKCGNHNYAFRTKCGAPSCHQACPSAGPHRFKADLLKCSAEDLMNYATQKLHPALNSAFEEAGTPFHDGEVLGDKNTILAALEKSGQRKMIRIVKQLSESKYLRGMVTHFFGNYTIQDLMRATSLLRAAAVDLQSTDKLTAEVLAKLTGGGIDSADAYGLLHEAVVACGMEAALHPQGSYVLQCALELCANQELLAAAAVLVPGLRHLAGHPRGVHIVPKLVDRLSVIAFTEGPMAEQAGQLLAATCRQMGAHRGELIKTAHQFTMGQMLTEAVQGALPRPEAVELAGMLASFAGQLSASRAGAATVRSLLQVVPADDESAVIARDVIVCGVARALEGEMAAVACRTETDGAQLLYQVLKAMVELGESGWVAAIVAELAGDAAKVLANKDAGALLASALSVGLLSDEAVEAHLAIISRLPNARAFADDVRQRRSHLEPQPALDPSLLSPIQPQHVPPPPPPPKAKAKKAPKPVKKKPGKAPPAGAGWQHPMPQEAPPEDTWEAAEPPADAWPNDGIFYAPGEAPEGGPRAELRGSPPPLIDAEESELRSPESHESPASPLEAAAAQDGAARGTAAPVHSQLKGLAISGAVATPSAMSPAGSGALAPQNGPAQNGHATPTQQPSPPIAFGQFQPGGMELRSSTSPVVFPADPSTQPDQLQQQQTQPGPAPNLSPQQHQQPAYVASPHFAPAPQRVYYSAPVQAPQYGHPMGAVGPPPGMHYVAVGMPPGMQAAPMPTFLPHLLPGFQQQQMQQQPGPGYSYPPPPQRPPQPQQPAPAAAPPPQPASIPQASSTASRPKLSYRPPLTSTSGGSSNGEKADGQAAPASPQPEFVTPEGLPPGFFLPMQLAVQQDPEPPRPAATLPQEAMPPLEHDESEAEASTAALPAAAHAPAALPPPAARRAATSHAEPGAAARSPAPPQTAGAAHHRQAEAGSRAGGTPSRPVGAGRGERPRQPPPPHQNGRQHPPAAASRPGPLPRGPAGPNGAPQRPAPDPGAASSPPAIVPISAVPAAAAVPPPWALPPSGPQAAWACAVCTFLHSGAKAQFLTCEMCGNVRP